MQDPLVLFDSSLDVLREKGVCRLPSVQNTLQSSDSTIPPLILARVLSRRAQRLGLFVHLRSGVPGPDTIAQARDGILFVGGEVPDPVSFLPQVHAHHAWLLLEGGEQLTLNHATLRALLLQDQWHAVASDPDLIGLREQLLRLQASRVLLRGPPQSGRSSLAGWLSAARTGHGPALIRPGEPAPPDPDGLRVYQDIEAPPEVLPPRRPPLSAPLRPKPTVKRATLQALRQRGLIGESPAFYALAAEIEAAATSADNLLLRGERGSGKTAISQVIHALSGRTGPWLSFNSGQQEQTWVDLVGHTKGAFTSADAAQEGLLKRSHQGTLFFDEMGNMNLTDQARVLPALENRPVRRFKPLGAGAKQVEADVRLIFASNANFEQMRQAQTFLDELWDRISPLQITLPPLRERGEDVLLLLRSMLKTPRHITPDAERALLGYRWPGNVRELQTVAARLNLQPSPTLELADLPAELRAVVEPPLTVMTAGPRGSGWQAQAALPWDVVAVDLPSTRSDQALRAAILGRIHGLAITEDALRWLVERLRVVGFALLDQLDLLSQRRSTALSLPIVQSMFPSLRTLPQPITVWWNPLQQGGELVGLQQTFTERFLLIGRVSSMAQLQAEDGESVAHARERLTARLRGERPAVLSLPWLAISRAHLLIEQRDGRLILDHLPDNNPLPVRALGDASSWVSLSGQMTATDAIQVQILPEIDLYIAVGEAGEQAILRGLGSAAPSGPTVARSQRPLSPHSPVLSPPAPSPQMPSQPLPEFGSPGPIWVLEPAEITLLLGLLEAFLAQGIRFAPFLRRSLRQHQGQPAARRLIPFLLRGDGREAQWCTRLFEHPDNEALRAAARALPATRRERLPSGITDRIT